MKIPETVGIIMDGNGRWAKMRGLSRTAGHTKGVETLRTIAKKCYDIGVKNLIVYAFSTENWNRPKLEVDHLMKLLSKHIVNFAEELGDRKVRIKTIGTRDGLSPQLIAAIDKAEQATKNNPMTLYIALNYGGRREIVDAVKKMSHDGALNNLDKIDQLTEDDFAHYLYASEIPNVDLIIRTSGEERISNFLLWQSAYSEYVFTDTLWPDFDETCLINAFEEYTTRNIRKGGV
ncbi:MAG: di-trans,poly-cis-decaprenylcistransferase [Clostridiales bacterium]|nr:di-trans,poly-cis-decaprenylcistransferase [Clostridiales bacterium]